MATSGHVSTIISIIMSIMITTTVGTTTTTTRMTTSMSTSMSIRRRNGRSHCPIGVQMVLLEHSGESSRSLVKSDNVEEKRRCLNTVLELDPQNEPGTLALLLFDQRRATS